MRTETVNPLDFLRAGGRLSLSEWLEMDADERSAFVAAGKEMVGEYAAEIMSVIGEEARLAALAEEVAP